MRGSRALTPNVSGFIAPLLIASPFFSDVKQIGVLRAGRRLDQTAKRVDEIPGDYRIAVRPFRFAQLEDVAQSVRARGPAFGDAGDEGAAPVIAHEAFEQVVDHVGLDHRRRFGGVERLRLAGRAAAVETFRACRMSVNEQDGKTGCDQTAISGGKNGEGPRDNYGSGETSTSIVIANYNFARRQDPLIISLATN